MVRRRPGITLDELALEQYGDADRTKLGRERAGVLDAAVRERGAAAMREWEIRASEVLHRATAQRLTDE